MRMSVFEWWRALRFAGKFVFLTSILFFISISLVVMSMFFYLEDRISENREEYVTDLVDIHRHYITNWFKNQENEIQLIASSVIGKHNSIIGLEDYSKIKDHHYYNENLFFFDLEGNILSQSETAKNSLYGDVNDMVSSNSKIQHYFNRAVEGEKIITKPYTLNQSGKKVVALLAPIKVKGENTGVSLGIIEIDRLEQLIFDIEGVKDSNIFFIDRNASSINLENKYQFDTNTANKIISLLKNNKNGFIKFKNSIKKGMVAKIISFPELEWALAIVYNNQGFYTVNTAYFQFLLIPLIIILGIYVAGIFLISKKIIGPLEIGIQELDTSIQKLKSVFIEYSQLKKNQILSGTKQVEKVKSTNSILAELSLNTKQTDKNVCKVQESVKKVQPIIHNGVETVEKMNVAIEEIKSSSNETSIIINTIHTIANQTNLLALNAAVEAARAGEAGKGFSIVAEEVRSLAQRSSEAVKNTSELIQRSQSSSVLGSDVIVETSDNLKTISEDMVGINVLISDIAFAAKEHAKKIDNLHGIMKKMEQAVQKNASTVNQTATLFQELSVNISKLLHIIMALKSLTDGKSAGALFSQSNQSKSTYTAKDFIEEPNSNYDEPSVDKIKTINTAFGK